MLEEKPPVIQYKTATDIILARWYKIFYNPSISSASSALSNAPSR